MREGFTGVELCWWRKSREVGGFYFRSIYLQVLLIEYKLRAIAIHYNYKTFLKRVCKKRRKLHDAQAVAGSTGWS